MKTLLVAMLLLGFAAEAGKRIPVRAHVKKDGSTAKWHTRAPPKQGVPR